MASTQSDGWLREYDDARRLADEVFLAQADRNDALRQGGDAAKLTAGCRRKISALNAKVERLGALLGSVETCEYELIVEL